MDGKANNVKKKNPREGANPLSALTFTWVLKTFWTGYKRDLEIEDLTKPLKEHTSSVLGEKIAKAWEDELESVEKNQQKKKKKSKPSLRRVLIKVFGARIALYGVALAFMEIVLRLTQPLFLGLLISYYRRLRDPYVPMHVPQNVGDTSFGRFDTPTTSLSPLKIFPAC